MLTVAISVHWLRKGITVAMSTADTVQHNCDGTDEDNEQSKPLLGDSVGDEAGATEGCPSSASSARKVAEYLPANREQLSLIYRVLRTLYGHLPATDVPRIVWVSVLVLVRSRCSFRAGVTFLSPCSPGIGACRYGGWYVAW